MMRFGSRLCLALVALISCASAARAGTVPVDAKLEMLIVQAKSTMLTDPRATIAEAESVQLMASSLPGKQRVEGVATARWLQAEAYLRLNDLTHAAPLINAALSSIASHAPTKLSGEILLTRGGYEHDRGDAAAALADYQHAYDVFFKLLDSRNQAKSLLSIAWLYEEAKDYNGALKYLSQALSADGGDLQLKLSTYNNRGSTLKEVGKLSEARADFERALKLALTLKSPILQAMIMRNIARTDLAAGRLAAAQKAIVAASSLIVDADDITRAQFSAVEAQAALQRGDLQRARKLISGSFATSDFREADTADREAHQTAFNIFSAVGDAPRALAHLIAVKRFDDRTTALATSTNTALAAARFDFANQELRIAKLNADQLQRNVAFERANAATQRSIFIGSSMVSVVAVGLLVFFLVTIGRSRNQVRAANVDLAATNDALARALAAKTDFLATTSHEIRTPLNGILGMTQVMLVDPALPPASRDRLNIIHGAGLTMRALVDDILDVAKIEDGRLSIEEGPFDLDDCLRDSCRMWEEQARGRGIGFDLDLADCPGRVVGDDARVRQIVFNLLSNALKFTRQGCISVRAARCADADRAVITVSDTGIGIPPDKLSIIFESFRQVDASTAREFGGTGLGLAICRNVAVALGGSVDVRSILGEGSTFTLDLPLPAASASVVSASVAAGPALLVVDPNPITCALLKAVLSPHVSQILTLSTIDDAVERMATAEFVVVLVDEAAIAASGGHDRLGRLCSSARDAGAITAATWRGPTEQDRVALTAAGVDRIIAKPIAGVALAAILFPTEQRIEAHLVSRAA